MHSIRINIFLIPNGKPISIHYLSQTSRTTRKDHLLKPPTSLQIRGKWRNRKVPELRALTTTIFANRKPPSVTNYCGLLWQPHRRRPIQTKTFFQSLKWTLWLTSEQNSRFRFVILFLYINTVKMNMIKIVAVHQFFFGYDKKKIAIGLISCSSRTFLGGWARTDPKS